MKRIFALLLVLTLFCPSALAETIRQQVNAPESLQDTFTSNTGRMTIDIKADVIVPDISTLYEIDVTPRLFNDEELSRLVKGFQQTDSQLDADYQVLFGILRLYEYKNAHIHLIASGMEDNGTWSDVTAKCVVSDETYLTGYMSVLQRMHEGPAAHCRYTLEEAKAIADQAAAIVAPNYAFSAWGLMELYPRDGSDTRTKDYDYWEGYQFCYTPVLEGIQILYTPNEDQSGGLTLQPVRQARLYISITDTGIYEIRWYGAQDIGEKTLVASPLPFEKIYEVAKMILPLAHMEHEKIYEDAAALVVDRIQLNYCRLQRRDKPGQFVLTPVWDFFGCRAIENKDGTVRLCDINPNNSLLTVNAIDGTVIDRNYGY